MGAYYWAGGRKVQLEPDSEHVAVDQAIAERAGLAAQLNKVAGAGTRVGGGVIVAPRSSLGEDMVASFHEAGALYPVYKRQSAMVVALPEIRIELDNSKQRRAVVDLLNKEQSRYEITEDADDKMVLRPASGKGADALKMANDIYEQAHPAAASVRFVQFVPKPTSNRS